MFIPDVNVAIRVLLRQTLTQTFDEVLAVSLDDTMCRFCVNALHLVILNFVPQVCQHFRIDNTRFCYCVIIGF